MPPTVPPEFQPRVVCYYQTHHTRNGEHISVLPFITEATDIISITHLIIAAFHLNDGPGNITLNDDAPSAPRNSSIWEEVCILQDIGVQVLGMLGGAAQGSFTRLDGSDADFEAYYTPLRDTIRAHGLDGLDLDVEEEMSLAGIIRLIDRLHADFGDAFLLTLSPVATALQRGRPHLSGFDYEALEVMRGPRIAWYNVQFYNNWGALVDFVAYDAILRQGWPSDKVVVGVLTNPANGQGAIPLDNLRLTLAALVQYYPRFGGVMGWEYFNSLPGGCERPWEWAELMMKTVRNL